MARLNPSDSGRPEDQAQPGEIIEQEVIHVEGTAPVVHRQAAPGEAVQPAAGSAAEGEVIEREVVHVEGAAPVVHRTAAPGEVLGPEVHGTVVSREIIPNASIEVRQETARFETETIHTETVTREAHPVETGLTSDVYTVGETFDPITHNPCDLHGIMVEYEDSEALLEGVRAARRAGYRKIDCYSPIPVEGLTDEMGWKDKKVPALMFCGGLTGFTLAWILQFSGMAWFYPVNIGGKPLNSWPQFVVPAFEMTILFTALTGVVSMIVLNGLPSPYHPVFNVPGFEAASTDRFFLCLEEGDAMWDRRQTLQLARTLGGVRVSEVQR